KDVEQAGIDDAIEPLLPLAERQRVFVQELDREPALGRLLPRPLERLLQKIDTGDTQSTAGEEKGGVPGATAGAEDGALDLAGDFDERLLRFADVPGRLARVKVFKRRPVRHAHAPLLASLTEIPSPSGSVYWATRAPKTSLGSWVQGTFLSIIRLWNS